MIRYKCVGEVQINLYKYSLVTVAPVSSVYSLGEWNYDNVKNQYRY